MFHADDAGVAFFAEPLGDGSVVEFPRAGFFASGAGAVLDVTDLIPDGFRVFYELISVADLSFMEEISEQFA